MPHSLTENAKTLKHIVLRKFLIVFTIFIILIAPIFTQQSVAESKDTFSIVWISDTQHLSKDYPDYFDKLCSWIAQNSETYNIEMVVHTGDIVSDGKLKQWLNANHSMGILLDNGIPYCWAAGNHDYIGDPWIGNKYSAFDPEVMQTKPYFVSTLYDGIDTAVRFNASGWECLIVNLAFRANDTELTWANDILNANPQTHAIITTHSYLKRDGTYDSWGDNLRSVIDNHTSVFLTLNGHSHPTLGKRAQAGDRHELLFDMQDTDDQVGAASARILTFDTSKGTITVQTYSVYSNQFLTDSESQFTLNTSFRNNKVGEESSEISTIIVAAALAIIIVTITLYLNYGKKNQRS